MCELLNIKIARVVLRCQNVHEIIGLIKIILEKMYKVMQARELEVTTQIAITRFCTFILSMELIIQA